MPTSRRTPFPTLIIVSGPAGSGKTTLAHRLAAEVGCPAICRDEIKEGMVHAASPRFVASVSDPLTVRTYGVFFATVQLLLRAEVTLVAEAAFQDPLWRRGLEPLLPLADVRVVRCWIGDDQARDRMRRRRAEQATRTAHADLDEVPVPSTFVAISLDVPTLDVDTSQGYRPALDDVVAFAR
ncbi:MAG: AAA family ATPase [Propionibacteriaceae bacterium]